MEDRNDVIQAEINALLNLLEQTDYKAIKHSEGLISEAEYASIKSQRETWRARINELQEELEAQS